MADSYRGRSQQIACSVVIVGAVVVLAFALLNPRPTALTWFEVALAAVLAIGAGYLIARGRRADNSHNHDES